MSDNDQAIRDVVKGASIVYVGLFLELVIAFFAQVLAARYLSVGGFGGLTTGTALLDIGSIIAGLGLAGGLTRYLPRIESKQKRSLVTTAVGISLTNAVIIGGLVALGAPVIATEVFGDPSVTVSIRIFGAAIPFSALLNIAIGGIRGEKEPLYRVYVKNITQPLIRFFLVIVAVVLGLDQAGIAGAYAFPYVVTSALALFLLYRTLPQTPLQIDVDLTERVARYSIPLIASGLAGFVYRSVDIFLILYFLDSSAVGVYGVAYAAVGFMQMFSTAFNFLGAPVASELEHDEDTEGVMSVFRPVSRWLVVASACAFVPLGVFSSEFISIIYGSAYAGGGLALAILAFGYGSQNVLSVNGPILQALGRSRLLAFNSVLAAIVNVVLNVLFIPRFGIVGAAVATSISFVLRDGLAAVEVRYLLDTTPIRGNVFGPALVAIGIFGVFGFIVAPTVPTTVLWLLGVSGVACLLYVVSVLVLFGISRTEVMILRSAEEQYGLPVPDPIVELLHRR
ncbi:flippase [Halapricum hydrolyticum]|uniref:Flippase n=1 Tax=Halapricum hydrolyticum TaxID=2979991 RepID=A0AAE3LHR5_9EURY|nr:flippase [Halapricum hydrolyticum]MCU4718034.1 flippase [Halapricum hydrolyticum]MCU4727199.1 flippase [Halapricum hydrolyticum]